MKRRKETLKSLYEMFEQQITVVMRERGFEPFRYGMEFTRQTPFGEHLFVLGLSQYVKITKFGLSYRNGYQVTNASLGVRYDTVETLLDEIHPPATRDSIFKRSSVGLELVPYAHGEWVFLSADDVENLCSRLMSNFDDPGIPFLQQFVSLQDLLTVLQEQMANSRFEPYVTEQMLATLYLLNQRDNFENHIERCRELILINGHEWYMSRFNQTVEALKERWLLSPY